MTNTIYKEIKSVIFCIIHPFSIVELAIITYILYWPVVQQLYLSTHVYSYACYHNLQSVIKHVYNYIYSPLCCIHLILNHVLVSNNAWSLFSYEVCSCGLLTPTLGQTTDRTTTDVAYASNYSCASDLLLILIQICHKFDY